MLCYMTIFLFFFFQAEDGIRDFCLSRGLGDVYKRQQQAQLHEWCWDYGYSYPVSFRGCCFKHYYKGYVCKHIRHLFLNLVSYNRFVELEKEIQLPLTIFIKKLLLGTCTGISFADSTPLHVCRNQRILIHKTFEGLAERGKCSMGWLFGFELHLIINDRGGKILYFMFTLGNVNDRKPLK